MRRLLFLLLLLLLVVSSASAAGPGGNIAIAADPNGNPVFLSVDSSGYIYPAGAGPGLPINVPGGNTGVAVNPSGVVSFLQVDANGGLLIHGGSGTVTSITPADSTLTFSANPLTTTGTIAVNLGALFSFHTSTNATATSTVSPSGAYHTEEVSFTGSAGTANVVLSTSAGYPQGSTVCVLAKFPNLTSGIVVKVYSASTSGTLLFSYTTDTTQNNAIFQAVVNASGTYDALMSKVPAF